LVTLLAALAPGPAWAVSAFINIDESVEGATPTITSSFSSVTNSVTVT